MPSFGSIADPPATFVLRGARVVDPADGSDAVRDLAVADGRIVGGDGPRPGPTLDGTGLVAAPGLCDLHTHLREPGNEAAETVASGARAAARGGFTTICAMPNTDPPPDEAPRVRSLASIAAGAAARVRIVGAATRGRAGERLAPYGELAEAGVVAFSDDGAPIGSAALMRHALGYAGELGLPVIEHAEEPTLARGASMRAGATATLLGLAGWPASAELAAVARDLALVAESGGRLHVTHLATAAGLAAIRRARADGVPVSCDVTPHHLALTDRWVAGDRRFAWEEPGELRLEPGRAYDGNTRVNPPLGTRADALALLEGLADGTIDAIATDHAPHTITDKLVPFGEAAPGISGLDTALSLVLAAVDAGPVPLPTALAALSTRPAALIGERRGLRPDDLADLVVFDPRARWRVSASALVSRGANTPLLGLELPGRVRLTVAAGRITYDELSAQARD